MVTKPTVSRGKYRITLAAALLCAVAAGGCDPLFIYRVPNAPVTERRKGMATHQLTMGDGAVTYRMSVYYFAGIKVDSEIHNHGAGDLTFDLAELAVTAGNGKHARPCLVWREDGGTAQQRTRLYPPDRPWYAWSQPGCPIPKATYVVTLKPAERAVFSHTLYPEGEGDEEVLDRSWTRKVAPGWRTLQVRNSGLSVGGHPLPGPHVTFELEAR